MIANYVKTGLICLCVLGTSNNSVAQTSGAPVKNIVLVHGASTSSGTTAKGHGSEWRIGGTALCSFGEKTRP